LGVGFFLFVSTAMVYIVLKKNSNSFTEEIATIQNTNTTQKQYLDKSTKTHNAYYMDKSFYGDLESLRQSPSEEKIYGGIISHHFLMTREIAGLISSLAHQKPKTIVIIGPNHFGVGDGDMLISAQGYNTPWGTVGNNTKIVSQLVDKKIVKWDESPFITEHSIATLAGFIKYFLPDTKIVPIVLKRSVSQERRSALANELTNILGEDDIILGSVDFSHHINAVASEFHDDRTIAIINDFDFDRLQSVEVDSPESLDVVLRYLESKEAKKMYSAHTNMSERVEDPLLEDGTSYLFAKFAKGNNQKQNKISVLSFGDMMLGRDVGTAIATGDNPFDQIQGAEGNFVRGIDIISANLEGPITTADNCSEKVYSFKFDPDSTVSLLQKHNFNAFNLSNNHAFDCYRAGFEDTKKYLSEGNLFYFGGDTDSKVKFKKIGDKKVAFVGIDTTINQDNNDMHRQDVAMAKNESDYVVINVHWGQEYKKNPTDKQIKLAHDLIDAGADVIIGHHPHVVESGEIYKNKPIFYSLGNFIFDQVGAQENEGMGVGVVFGGEYVEYYLFPYNINKYHPQLMSMKKTKEFCDTFMDEMNVYSNHICHFVL